MRGISRPLLGRFLPRLMAALSSVPPSLFDRFSTMAAQASARRHDTAPTMARHVRALSDLVAIDGKYTLKPVFSKTDKPSTAAGCVRELVKRMSIVLSECGPRASKEQRFSTVAENYQWHVANEGWPPLSGKALSRELVLAGCVRIDPDSRGYPRKRFPARPVLIVFPGASQ